MQVFWKKKQLNFCWYVIKIFIIEEAVEGELVVEDV